MDLQFVVHSGESLRPNSSTRRAIKAHVMRRYRHNQRQMRLQKKIQTRDSALDCCTEQAITSYHKTNGSRFTPMETPSSHASTDSMLVSGTWPEEDEFSMDRFDSIDQWILSQPSHSVSPSQFDPFDTLPVAMTPRLSTLLYQGKYHFGLPTDIDVLSVTSMSNIS